VIRVAFSDPTRARLLDGDGRFEVVSAGAEVLVWSEDDDPPETDARIVALVGEGVSPPDGAAGVLPLSASPQELAAAIEAVAAGLLVTHPATRSAPVLEELTPREIEVLRLLADGDGNKTIAYRLGISEHTVKFHVSSILAKLGAGSRTEAVTLGLRRGLILL